MDHVSLSILTKNMLLFCQTDFFDDTRNNIYIARWSKHIFTRQIDKTLMTHYRRHFHRCSIRPFSVLSESANPQRNPIWCVVISDPALSLEPWDRPELDPEALIGNTLSLWQAMSLSEMLPLQRTGTACQLWSLLRQQLMESCSNMGASSPLSLSLSL